MKDEADAAAKTIPTRIFELMITFVPSSGPLRVYKQILKIK